MLGLIARISFASAPAVRLGETTANQERRPDWEG